MAELRIFDNFFEDKYKSFSYEKSFDIKKELEKHADDETYQNLMVECYDEETGETFFAPMVSDSNSDSLLILVNNKAVDFNYTPKSDDLVTVVFLPTDGSRTAYQWGGGIIGNILGSIVGAAAGAIYGIQGGIPGIIAGAIVGCVIGAVYGTFVGIDVGGQIYDQKNQSYKTSYDTGESGEQLPDVRGAENQALTGNAFPCVIGKKLITPFIIGSPYTTYENSNGKDAVIREILVAGYAPLKLTDFKLGDTWLCYNRTNGVYGKNTVLSGTLTKYTRNDYLNSCFYFDSSNTLRDLIETLCPKTDIDNFRSGSYDNCYMYFKESETSTTKKTKSIHIGNTSLSSEVLESGFYIQDNSSSPAVKLAENLRLDSKLPFYSVEIHSEPFWLTNKTDAEQDILPYWDNNDVELEIIQQSPDEDIHQSKIYPSKVVDTDVNANLLYVVDGSIEEIAKKKNIIYKNTGFINGLQTNRVQFTESCPLEFTVNLDLPNGLYSQWSWDGDTKYGEIPLWIALQWRFYSEDNSSSDEKGADGYLWNNFKKTGYDDYASYLSNFSGTFREYTQDECTKDLQAHEGNTFEENITENENEDFISDEDTVNVLKGLKSIPYAEKIELRLAYFNRTKENFHRTYRVYLGDSWVANVSTEDDEKIQIIKDNDKDFSYLRLGNISYIFSITDFEIGDYKAVIGGCHNFDYNNLHYYTNFRIVKKIKRSLSAYANSWLNEKLLDFQPYSKEDDSNSRISEIRASFTCKLNLDSCKKIIQDKKNKVKGIEVRAIRVSPNYLNMTKSWGKDDKGSPKQYADSIVWTSLVTRTFDENRLTELLNKQDLGETDNGNTVTDDYILSEIPEKILSDADMRKLCLVAIKAKADVNGTIQNQMKSLNCIAESFSPYFDEDEKTWLPRNVHKQTGYFKPSNNTWEEVTKEEYEEARKSGLSWLKENQGSNFNQKMLSLLMRCKGVNENVVLPSIYSIYNKNNAVSSLMLALVGGQNGVAGFGYEDLDMLSFTDGYNFCESVVDGSTYSTDTTDDNGFHAKGDLVSIKYEANAYLYQQQTLENLIKKLAVCARGVITYDNYGRLRLIIDKAEDYPKGIISQQTCISGTSTYNWSEQVAGLQFTFQDENDGYEQNQVYCWNDNNSLKSYKGQVQSYNIDYVTNPQQLWSLGRYVLACSVLQREILTRKIGAEGELFNLGDTVLVQDNSLLLGDGSARIQEVLADNNYIYGFITDTPFSYKADVKDGKCEQGVTVLQPKKFGKSRTVTLRLATNGTSITLDDVTYTMTQGVTNVCILDEKVERQTRTDYSSFGATTYSFETGDIVLFGDFTQTSQRYRISKIKPEQDGSFTETLIPYFDELYNYGAAMPSFQSPAKMPSPTQESFTLVEVPTTIADFQKSVTDLTENTTNILQTKELPDKPIVSAKASKDSIVITCSQGGTLSNNSIKMYTVWLYKGASDTTGTEITFSDSTYTYNFLRIKDGYPEAEDFSNWFVKAKALNFYNLESEYSEKVAVDASDYGTWKFGFTSSNIDTEVIDRTVTIKLSTSKLSNAREVYGNPKYKVQISRIGYAIDDSGSETEVSIADLDSNGSQKFYAPAMNTNPYPSGSVSNNDYKGNEDTYKNTSGDYYSSNSRFSQTLPLFGQEKYTYDETSKSWISTSKKIQNTSYTYRISAYNESGFETNAIDITLTALCSSIRDIVYAHNYYKNFYVKNLSAINANIGLISQGGFGDIETWNNFWALSDLSAEEAGKDVKRGAFRVGDNSNYITVVPPNSTIGEGATALVNDTDNYMVCIKAGNITLTTAGTDFKSGTYIYDENDDNKRMHLISGGFEIQAYEAGTWITKATIFGDVYGNFTISNMSSDDSSLPKVANYVSGATIYHLEGTTNDTNGGNSANINFVKNSYSKSDLIFQSSLLFNGKAEKTLADEDICLFTDSDIMIGGQLYNPETNEITDTLAKQWNDLLGTTKFILDEE